MTMSKASLVAAVASVAIFSGRATLAQTSGATVHGHVQNAAGQTVTTGEVKFTTEKTTPTKELKFDPSMVFPIGPDGNYKATGIKPGDYFVFFMQGDKVLDREDLTVTSNDTDKTLDDDMTRAEYIKSLSPEEQKQLEEFKKKNAAIMQTNAVIANLNKTLKKVQADIAAAAPTKGDVSEDVTMMQQTVQQKADEPVLWVNYANAQLAQADHLAAEDKKAGKQPTTDDDTMKMYAGAVESFQKSIDLDKASKKPNPASEAASYNQMGNALAHSGKGDEAAKVFEQAVTLQPSNADMYYRNEAVVLYNANQFDQAEAAADKAIAANANDAVAYYIKGQSLVTKATVDSKTGTTVAPPGCVEAYQKFLELAPANDPKVAEVNQMLAALGQKVETKFKAGKKH